MPSSCRYSPMKNRPFQRENVQFPWGNHLRRPMTLILSGPTDPRFQGETSSVPHEEREHGYQKGRSEGSREARREEGRAEESGRSEGGRRASRREARRGEARQARPESGVHEAHAAVRGAWGGLRRQTPGLDVRDDEAGEQSSEEHLGTSGVGPRGGGIQNRARV